MALRETVNIPCPGSSSNFVIVVNTPNKTQWGLSNPANSGSCSLFLGGLDENGKPMDDGRNVFPQKLNPGDSLTWYWPPSGATAIFAVCSNDCNSSGTAVLEYDTPDS